MRFTFCFSRSCSPYPISFALRSCPCCPGAKFLFSIPQEGLKHLSPFRNSFIPSLRHNLHTGPIYLAKLNSPSLGRAAAVVRDRGHISNGADFQTRSLQCSDSRIPSRTGSLHTHFESAHTRFARAVCGGYCSLLGCEWRPFARTFEAKRAGAGPTHDIPFQIRYRDRGVIERSLNVSYACRHDFLFLLLCTFFLRLTCHQNSPFTVGRSAKRKPDRTQPQ